MNTVQGIRLVERAEHHAQLPVAVQFSEAARALSKAARRLGLVVPSFRSPPRVSAQDRTIRRRADGTVAIAVRLSGRPFPAVLADMVEGVLAVNELQPERTAAVRRSLWNALEQVESQVSPVRPLLAKPPVTPPHLVRDVA
jgi:hypothetical protein